MGKSVSENFEKLKALLSELFQLDQAELDFGIYRIMNARRQEIERFLENDLLPQVRDALQEYEKENRGLLQADLDKAIEAARAIGVNPETTPKVQQLRAKLAQAMDETAVEEDVFIDECHRSAWGKWSMVLTRNPDAVQVGLTATPWQLRITEESRT
jgi:adenine-specific DNA-methyltransferase